MAFDMQMNVLRRVALTSLIVVALIRVACVKAENERVAFPANYKSGVLYNIVDREDQKEIHQQYTSHEAIEAARKGKPLPVGTVITSAAFKALLDSHGDPVRDAKGSLVAGELARFSVMQKRACGGLEYPESVRNGEWQFAAFDALGKHDEHADLSACMACHKPHEHLDYVKTYLAMAGKRVETNPRPVPAGARVMTVVRFAVSPAHLTVRAGTPITWINADDPPHQFVVDGAGVKTDYLLKGQTGTVVLNEPGLYHFGDTFYPAIESLKGSLEVVKR